MESSNYTNSTNTPSIDPRHSPPGGAVPFWMAIMLECACLTVILGNLLVILAVCSYKQRTPPDVLILSLSLADLLDSAVALQILVVVKYVLTMPWSQPLCDCFIVLLYTFRTASASTVTFMAIERALLLVYPIKHRTMVTLPRTTKAILGIWVFSLFCGVLPFIGAGHSSFNKQDKTCLYQLYDLGIGYTVVFEVLGGLMLLVTLVSFIAIKVSSGKFLRRQTSMGLSLRKISREELCEGGAGRRVRGRSHYTAGMTSVRRLTIMMSIVVLVYFISWMPFLLNNLASLITNQPPRPSISLIASMISFLHAVANPLLYGKMSQRYRRGYVYVLRRMLAICGGKNPTDVPDVHSTALAPSQAYVSQVSTADNSGYRAGMDSAAGERASVSLAVGVDNNKRVAGIDHVTSPDSCAVQTEQHVTSPESCAVQAEHHVTTTDRKRVVTEMNKPTALQDAARVVDGIIEAVVSDDVQSNNDSKLEQTIDRASPTRRSRP